MSIAELFTRAKDNTLTGGKRFGVELAKVTNITDPEKLNRVKCQSITGETDVGETDWAFVTSPFGGNGYGIYFMPKVGDLVLLCFIDGDVHAPIVIGSVWTKDPPKAPYSIADGKNETFSIKLPSGTEVLFKEEPGKESVQIKTKKGHTLLLDDGNKKVEIKDDTGNNGMTFDLNSGAATLSGKAKITLKAGSGASIEMDGNGGKITVKANSAIEVKAAQIKLDASGALEIKGGGSVKLQSSGIAEIKGSLLKLN